MKRKKIRRTTAALAILAIVTLILLVPFMYSANDSADAATNVVYSRTYEETLPLAIGSMNGTLPMFLNATGTPNSCGAVAGAVLFGYYDYACPNLIPNFTSVNYINGVPHYATGGAAVDSTVAALNTAMGNTGSGVTESAFRTGLSSVAANRGYSVSYQTLMTPVGSRKDLYMPFMANALNQNKPVVLFMNNYATLYYEVLGTPGQTGWYTDTYYVSRKDKTHIAVAYSINAITYCHYAYEIVEYSMLGIPVYGWVLVGDYVGVKIGVSLGDGTLATLFIYNEECSYIDEAYAVTIA